MELGVLIDLLKIISLPLTVIFAIIILRPFIKDLLTSATKIEFKPIEFESYGLEPGEKDLGEGMMKTIGVSRVTSKGLAETSREKLEKLRLLLESEQINQLIQYHANSLSQSKISFGFSLGAATLGFVIIIVGVMSILLSNTNSVSYLTIVSGAIIDAVASLFFVQSNQARKSMTEFFDKLRLDRQFNESLRLCDSIPDPKIQSMLKAQLALFFSGMPKDSDFVKILESFQNTSGVSDKTTNTPSSENS